MGYVLLLVPQAAYTGQLVINYRAPVPVGVDLDVRAWLEDRAGRKLRLRAEMSHDGQVLCDADGLFIALRADGD
jgi:acyl-CoA thioesterase FadM